MKLIILALVLAVLPGLAFPQNSSDLAIKQLTEDLAQQLIKAGKKKIAIAGVTNVSNQSTIAGNELADLIAIHLKRVLPKDFRIIDRQYVARQTSVNNINLGGYDLDLEAVRQLWKVIDAEVILVGRYLETGGTLRLTLKVLDSKAALVAAARDDIPMDDVLKDLLKTSQETHSEKQNEPAPSGNKDDETKKKECEIQKTGSYCFKNDTRKKFAIYLEERSYANGGTPHFYNSTIEPGETYCFKDLPATRIRYSINLISSTYELGSNSDSKGYIYVEKCIEKTHTIK